MNVESPNCPLKCEVIGRRLHPPAGQRANKLQGEKERDSVWLAGWLLRSHSHHFFSLIAMTAATMLSARVTLHSNFIFTVPDWIAQRLFKAHSAN